MKPKKLNRLKVVLAELDITSAELAEALSKNKVTVSRWCTNESQPSLETLYEIADFLKISVKDLLTENK